MKVKVALFLAGLVLGSSGSVFAATSYWEQSGRTYFCRGIPAFVECRDEQWRRPFSVILSKRDITLYEGRVPVFTCPVRFRSYDCIDFR